MNKAESYRQMKQHAERMAKAGIIGMQTDWLYHADVNFIDDTCLPAVETRIVCYEASCTIKNFCGIYLPDNMESRRSFVKPGEKVKMRKYKQNPDGSCNWLKGK